MLSALGDHAATEKSKIQNALSSLDQKKSQDTLIEILDKNADSLTALLFFQLFVINDTFKKNNITTIVTAFSALIKSLVEERFKNLRANPSSIHDRAYKSIDALFRKFESSILGKKPLIKDSEMFLKILQSNCMYIAKNYWDMAKIDRALDYSELVNDMIKKYNAQLYNAKDPSFMLEFFIDIADLHENDNDAFSAKPYFLSVLEALKLSSGQPDYQYNTVNMIVTCLIKLYCRLEEHEKAYSLLYSELTFLEKCKDKIPAAKESYKKHQLNEVDILAAEIKFHLKNNKTLPAARKSRIGLTKIIALTPAVNEKKDAFLLLKQNFSHSLSLLVDAFIEHEDFFAALAHHLDVIYLEKDGTNQGYTLNRLILLRLIKVLNKHIPAMQITEPSYSKIHTIIMNTHSKEKNELIEALKINACLYDNKIDLDKAKTTEELKASLMRIDWKLVLPKTAFESKPVSLCKTLPAESKKSKPKKSPQKTIVTPSAAEVLSLKKERTTELEKEFNLLWHDIQRQLGIIRQYSETKYSKLYNTKHLQKHKSKLDEIIKQYICSENSYSFKGKESDKLSVHEEIISKIAEDIRILKAFEVVISDTVEKNIKHADTALAKKEIQDTKSNESKAVSRKMKRKNKAQPILSKPSTVDAKEVLIKQAPAIAQKNDGEKNQLIITRVSPKQAGPSTAAITNLIVIPNRKEPLPVLEEKMESFIIPHNHFFDYALWGEKIVGCEADTSSEAKSLSESNGSESLFSRRCF